MKECIVIDNGSGFLKIGVGSAEPLAVLSNCVGAYNTKDKRNDDPEQNQKEKATNHVFYGEDALCRSRVLDEVVRPMQHGRIFDEGAVLSSSVARTTPSSEILQSILCCSLRSK